MSSVADAWVAATLGAADELAVTALGYSGARTVADRQPSAPVGVLGAYLPLIGARAGAQVGIVAEPSVATALAEALLGCTPTEEDTADAMAEIVNIVGGGVKSRLVELDSTLKLGLPVLVEGRLRSFARQQTISVPIEMGELPVWIVILLSLEE